MLHLVLVGRGTIEATGYATNSQAYEPQQSRAFDGNQCTFLGLWRRPSAVNIAAPHSGNIAGCGNIVDEVQSTP